MPPETLLNVESIQANRIMVIAPHPDDESLGCGGLINLLARAGRKFHIVFVTEGGASHPNSTTWPRHRLTAQREKEATNALAKLGIAEHPRSFLKLLDAAMPEPSSPAGEQAIIALAHIISEFQPDLVLLPWRRDVSGDHRATWKLSQDALAAAKQTPATFEYTIWLEEYGDPEDYPREGEVMRMAFDITEAQDAKLVAILAHVSQTTLLIDDDPNGFCLNPRDDKTSVRTG